MSIIVYDTYHMNKYIFILGKNPELSQLEITSLFPQKNIYYKSDQCLIIESDELNIANIQKRLGGTIKIGEFIEEITIPPINGWDILYYEI